MKNAFDDFLDETGNIHFSDDDTLVDYVERNVRDKADTLAYRFMDYSRERDGEAIELTWAQFGKRLRAIAARLQQVTKPGDRVAILAPQSLEYVIGFFGSLYAGNIAVPLFLPIFIDAGVNLVWLATLICINLQTSFLTPPFGWALFFLRGVAPPEIATGDIYRGVWTFIGLQLLALVLVFQFPALALWLPKAIGW